MITMMMIRQSNNNSIQHRSQFYNIFILLLLLLLQEHEGCPLLFLETPTRIRYFHSPATVRHNNNHNNHHYYYHKSSQPDAARFFDSSRIITKLVQQSHSYKRLFNSLQYCQQRRYYRQQLQSKSNSDGDDNDTTAVSSSSETSTTFATTITTTKSSSSSASSFDGGCQFSMKFIPYKIELTPPPRKDEQNKNTNIISSFFGSTFFGSSSAAAKTKIQNDIGTNGVVEWFPKLDTLECYTTLWNVTSRIINSYYENDDDKSLIMDRTVAVCFPDAQEIVVKNWYEIYIWLIQQQQQQTIFKSDNSSNHQEEIIVEFGNTYNIPRIEFRFPQRTKSFDSSTMQSNNNNDNNNNCYYDPTVVTKRTQEWVKRVLVQYGICPFTKSSKRSGQGLADVDVPVALIAYHASQASYNSLQGWIQLQADIWDAIVHMFIRKGPSGPDGISSILLAAPSFDTNFAVWAGPIFASFEAGVIAAQCSSDVGIVCFHPAYATPDGTTWPGFGQMHSVPRLQKWYVQTTEGEYKQQQKKLDLGNLHRTNNNNNNIDTDKSNDCPIDLLDPPKPLSNDEIAAGGAWQRRTPHATINVLRANQLAAAESKRNTPLLYTMNIKKLILDVGSDQLESDLQKERNLQ